MKPWRRLAVASAPDGGEYSLWQRDTELVLRVNGIELMSSRRHGSEQAMATAAESAIARRHARVLIGGLGFGYTLRATLDRLAPDGQIQVAELSSDIIEWNRQWVGELNSHPMRDARVVVTHADLRDVLSRAAAPSVDGGGLGGGFDAVLIDIDNGPWPVAARANRSFWLPEGVLAITRVLRPDAVLVVWSTDPDASFAARLRAAGFAAEVQPARGHGSGGAHHHLFVAKWRGPS